MSVSVLNASRGTYCNIEFVFLKGGHFLRFASKIVSFLLYEPLTDASTSVFRNETDPHSARLKHSFNSLLSAVPLCSGLLQYPSMSRLHQQRKTHAELSTKHVCCKWLSITVWTPLTQFRVSTPMEQAWKQRAGSTRSNFVFSFTLWIVRCFHICYDRADLQYTWT
jgi:hypothetical protein